MGGMTVDGMECEKGRELQAEVSDLLLTTYYLLLTTYYLLLTTYYLRLTLC